MSDVLKIPDNEILPAGASCSTGSFGCVDVRPQGADLPHDARLRLSRRIDWRFLLSSPMLGRVAAVSPTPTMLTSLEAFSEDLTLFGSSPIRRLRLGDDDDYDVIVLQDPAAPLLAEMARLVRPGGHLYVEVTRPLLRSLRGELRTFADYAAKIRPLDFTELAFHWHWPNFENCTDLVPLDDPMMLRSVLAQRAGSLGWWKTAMARLLVAHGSFACFVPCFSFVAQRRADG